MFQIYRIAFAGGPGSGKTTSLNYLRDHVNPAARHKVIFMPEVATEFFTGRPDEISRLDSPLLRQHYIYHTQLMTDRAIVGALETVGNGKDVVLLTDRGICDVRTFLDDREAELLLNGQDHSGYYDAVLLFDCATEANLASDDTTRIENNYDEVVEQSRRAEAAWGGCPNLRHIPQYAELSEKFSAVVNALNELLGETVFL